MSSISTPHVEASSTQLDRLNPVTRIGLAVLMSIAILISLDWLSATIMTLGQALIYLACGVPAGRLLRRMIPVAIIAPIGAISMLLYAEPEGRIWWQWGLVTISDGSLSMALAALIRIFALGLGAVILLGEVDQTAMADGLAQIVRLPAKFVLGTLAGMRTIGLFVEDWRMMTLARRARGLGDHGRIRRLFTMFFALLVFAIRRGTKLATAMEARGFGAFPDRTWARPTSLRRADAAGWLMTLLLCALAIGAAAYFGTLRMIIS